MQFHFFVKINVDNNYYACHQVLNLEAAIRALKVVFLIGFFKDNISFALLAFIN